VRSYWSRLVLKRYGLGERPSEVGTVFALLELSSFVIGGSIESFDRIKKAAKELLAEFATGHEKMVKDEDESDTVLRHDKLGFALNFV
jgi:hypothetical protein